MQPKIFFIAFLFETIDGAKINCSLLRHHNWNECKHQTLILHQCHHFSFHCQITQKILLNSTPLFISIQNGIKISIFSTCKVFQYRQFYLSSKIGPW